MSTAQRTKPLPAELPEKPDGYKRQLLQHLKLATGGCGDYAILDPDGEPMPIGYTYYHHKRKPEASYNGFFLHEDRGTIHTTWAELRQAWAKHYNTTPPSP
jgi:hypothetical protein